MLQSTIEKQTKSHHKEFERIQREGDQEDMSCKDKCRNYDPQALGKYADGFKRCSVCEVFLKFEGRYCPCCGVMLRVSPKGVRPSTKKNFLKAKGVKRI